MDPFFHEASSQLRPAVGFFPFPQRQLGQFVRILGCSLSSLGLSLLGLGSLEHQPRVTSFAPSPF